MLHAEKDVKAFRVKNSFHGDEGVRAGKKVFVIRIEKTLLQNQVTIVSLIPLFKKICL